MAIHQKHTVSRYKQTSALYRIKSLNTPWREVMHLGVTKEFPRHTEFIEDQDDSFYLMLQGTLRLSGLSASGRERVIMYMESDCIFGEVVYIHKSPMHDSSLTTIEKSEIVAFPVTLLDDVEFCRQYPHLILNLVHSIGIKAGAFFSQIYDSSLLESKTQICRLIYQMWKENLEAPSFQPGISQSDMASILGLHRSSLTRNLQILREEGIISGFTKTQLEITNARKLAELAEVISILDV